MLKVFIVTFFAFQLSASSNGQRVAVSFPKDKTTIVVEAMKSCIAKTGANPNVIEVISSGKVSEDEKFKEFFYCTCNDIGVVNPDGHIKVKECIELFPKETQPLVEPVIKNCDKEGVNKYDTLFKFLKCFQETSPVRVALA
ncbi:general odorant-binding protein 83a-like [Bombyx mandarina]|uniref:General odorant-binding protein 83a-like n=1 Tax=Bombyx mandarina TaxID=7092 RepID=A0A6J2KDF1_BOMMA|nr:general odorant-binding protein 83a-like [Bombyx mandarina]